MWAVLGTIDFKKLENVYLSFPLACYTCEWILNHIEPLYFLPITRHVVLLVCFVSEELIEVETEFAGDTLDGIRDDEMNLALNNIFQSNYVMFTCT